VRGGVLRGAAETGDKIACPTYVTCL
jgi:hypothetical protein